MHSSDHFHPWVLLETRVVRMSNLDCFTPGEKDLVPTEELLCGQHNWTWHFKEQINLLFLPGIEPRIVQAVVQSLYRLLCCPSFLLLLFGLNGQ
jgi:hypothetical protein